MLKLAKYATLIALTTLAVAAPVAAQEQMSVEIKTADLDLATAKDRARLNMRIKTAARSICGNAGNNSVQAQQANQICIQKIIDSSQPQVRYAISKSTASDRQAANSTFTVGVRG